MTGDQEDFARRIRAVLPCGWFPESAPVLDGLIGALASGWGLAYALCTYVVAQTRLSTASGVWLDMIAWDFFGRRVARAASEVDDALRARIGAELIRERATRAAIISAIEDMTGTAPVVFEPARAADTGGWSGEAAGWMGAAYGAAGGWGSLALPFQCFVTVYRPAGPGVPLVGGWGSGAGGYGAGSVEYATGADLQGGVTDASLYAAVAGAMPAAAVAWTQLTHRGN